METEFDNKDNFSAITTFTANKMAAKNRPKPVIRNLKLVEPSETLLKLLLIKDEEADIYQQNKSLLDPNYQVIKGEVEVNGITFDLCLVISKDEQIFTDEVIANSNMTPEQIEKYKQGKRKQCKEYRKVQKVHHNRITYSNEKIIECFR